MSNFKNYVQDAARKMACDDAQSAYAQHLVTATLQELFRFQYRQTPWASGELISISSNMDAGAASVAWMSLGDVGGADLVADNATELPTADLQGSLNINKAHTISTSIVYSTQELRQSNMQAMFDLANEKARSARQAHDRKLDELIRLGSSAHSILGVTNAPGSWHVTATTGNWGTSATAVQIVADFIEAYSTMFDGTGGVEEPDTCVMASSVYVRLATLQNSVASDKPVLGYLKEAFPNITLWKSDAGLNAAGNDGGPAMMLYSRDSSKLKALMPLMFSPLPLQQEGLVFKMAFESRFAGIATPRPKSILKLSNI
jgi:hypothetical protein